jgi:hypothetical protein
MQPSAGEPDFLFLIIHTLPYFDQNLVRGVDPNQTETRIFQVNDDITGDGDGQGKSDLVKPLAILTVEQTVAIPKRRACLTDGGWI